MSMSTQPLEHVSFDQPDEVREGENWRMELVNLAGGAQVGQDHRATRLAMVDEHQARRRHRPVHGPAPAVLISGRIHVVMADGTEFETVPGEITSLPPGTTPGWSATSRSSRSTGKVRRCGRATGGVTDVSFLQIIEFTTSRAEELNALLDEWLEQTEGSARRHGVPMPGPGPREHVGADRRVPFLRGCGGQLRAPRDLRGRWPPGRTL